MKEYGDERFIYRINLEQGAEKEEVNDIRNGFAMIDGNRIVFKERAIVEDRLFMIVPANFELMPLELAKIKYPNENRPSIILSDERGATTINFTLRDEDLDFDDVEDAKNSIQQLIQKMYPSYKIINSAVIETPNVRVGYFDFVSPTIDIEVYNLMFMFPLDGKLVLGTFNCLHLDMAAWLEITDQMIRSIRVL